MRSVMLKTPNIVKSYMLLCSPHLNSGLLQITTGSEFQCQRVKNLPFTPSNLYLPRFLCVLMRCIISA